MDALAGAALQENQRRKGTSIPPECSAPKSIFNSIGIIITQISKPTGKLTLAISIAPIALNTAGNPYPSAMPTTMHKATQAVR